MNDELNNVFSKYDRYMGNRAKDQPRQPPPQKQPARAPATSAASATGSTTTTATDTAPPLIDFGAEDTSADLSQRLAAMGKIRCLLFVLDLIQDSSF